MGDYNPNAPQVLGQQWVPARDEDVEFSPAVNVYEVGHRFTTTADRVLQDGRFYVNTLPESVATGQVLMVGVYPADTEDLTGPVRSVIIPVSSGSITGADASFVKGATSVEDALASPSDVKAIEISAAGTAAVAIYFNVSDYQELLVGKRIVDVRLLYAIGDTSGNTTTDANSGSVIVYTSNDFTYRHFVPVPFGGNSSGWNSAQFTIDPIGDSPRTPWPKVRSLDLGEIDHFWSLADDPWSTVERLPWTLDGLLRYQASSATPRFVLAYFGNADNMEFTYAALEVRFCEEQRVAYGGVSFGQQPSPYTVTGNVDQYYVQGANIVPMRSTGDLAENPVLSADTGYDVVVSSAEVGNLARFYFSAYTGAVDSSSYPKLNAIREQAAISSHPGVKVGVTRTVDKVFTKETTHILPQLSLHTSGGPLQEVHVYGRQARGLAYGSVTATQDIYDVVIGSAIDWTQVRFAARRFGNTTVSLTLDCPAIPGSSASITPDEFDALDTEIVDGWKMVTLDLSAAASMGTGTAPEWRWSATGEDPGNRWEVLGAIAPALSGVPGNLLNTVPSPNQLSIATYGQPVSGAGIQFGWISGYSPLVSATTEDAQADAFLLFGQDLPAVTGFSVVVASQAVTGIGQNCGIDPCGIPSGIYYHQLTWSDTSSSIAVANFGYYEIQRMDEVDSWQTIAQVTSPTGQSFYDYEARAGLESSYRVRAVDSYDFVGPWSDTAVSTITAPGVSGSGCLDATGNHVLIFTTNEMQNGRGNLAYSSAWEGAKVEESFNFPEAGFTQLQAMYNRDDFVAFTPTERGGDQFQRTLLVQAAAISAPTLPGFKSLRDMAWNNVSYVCVRDEEGNRWFAHVAVPDGKVVNRRRQYLASVAITEVSEVPSTVVI